MLFSNLFKEKPFKIENYALKLSLEWERGISERLLEKFPNLSKEQINYYENLCKNVKDDCWNCVDYNGPQINIDEFVNALDHKIYLKYTWIDKNNKRTLYSQFSYYFWKEGVLK